MSDPAIMSAARMLRDIDKTKGERTVGARRADAHECAVACGISLQHQGSEHVHPVITSILEAAKSMR